MGLDRPERSSKTQARNRLTQTEALWSSDNIDKDIEKEPTTTRRRSLRSSTRYTIHDSNNDSDENAMHEDQDNDDDAPIGTGHFRAHHPNPHSPLHPNRSISQDPLHHSSPFNNNTNSYHSSEDDGSPDAEANHVPDDDDDHDGDGDGDGDDDDDFMSNQNTVFIAPPIRRQHDDDEQINDETPPLQTSRPRRAKKILSPTYCEDDENNIGEQSDEDHQTNSHAPRETRSGTHAIQGVTLRLPLSAADKGIMLKSGRCSKPPNFTIPSPPKSRRRTNVKPVPSRDERANRRRRDSSFDIQDDDGEVVQPSRLSKRRKTNATDPHNSEDEFDRDDDEVLGEGDGEASPYRTRKPSSRIIKAVDLPDGPLRRTRHSTRRMHDVEANDPPPSNPYRTRHRTAMDRRKRAGRSLRNSTTNGKESDDDEGAKDEDFQEPSNSEDDESDDQLEDCEEENESRGAHESQDESDDRVQTRRRARNRKPKPQRSVSQRRRSGSSRSRKKASKGQDTFANNMAKSFTPRNGSLRPSNFYSERPDATSESSISTSDNGGREGRRSRPTRQAATRASDAIANELNKSDLLQNPMAIIDGGKLPRPKRTDRYSRHHGRIRPSHQDPFASDDDGAGVNVSPIEPMEVDANLSWDDIGGLEHHVRALKEMVFLPLMYPEVFEKFGTEAPKGVLFYGPPGTGKTLCARALAASCGVEAESGDAADTPNDAGAMAKPSGQNADKPDSTSERPILQTDGNGRMDKEHNEGTADPIMKPQSDPLAPSTGDRIAVDGAPPQTGKLDGKREDALQGITPVVNNNPDRTAAGKMKDGNSSNQVGEDAGDSAKISDENKQTKKKPRVAFFMRNGADCLSKWVGEAERQLRMTFEAAKRHQPAIIFFDEIDGLAPVRSSRQDQIHSSIVSTLLGLMDGLDARGKIVVIGATNRVDAIDPALRRPGRFDRELVFTLPNAVARQRILQIHTSKWSPPPKPHVVDAVSKMTVGYCGADLKALCSESAIRALRRRYPQIYNSTDKLLINVDEVRVATRDFLAAMSDVVPASHRSASTCARPLSQRLKPVLQDSLRGCISILRKVFPQGLSAEALRGAAENLQNGGKIPNNGDDSDELDGFSSPEDEEEQHIDVATMQNQISNAGRLRPISSGVMIRHKTLRPRLLVCGDQGLGQAQLGPALLHWCEGCPVHAIDFPSLHGDMGSRSAEEALTTAFREAARSVPSILYLPHLQLWWASAPQTLQTTLIISLKDLPSDLPLLVLATAEEEANSLPQELVELFGDVHQLSAPTEELRREMFAQVMQEAQAKPSMSNAVAKRRRHERVTEVLPKAPAPKPKPITASDELKKLHSESRYIRMLRMEMRNFVESLLRDRRFKAFWAPVDPDSAPDYYTIIKIPMDIQKIAARVDKGSYPTVLAMVHDFDIMVNNAIQYNPPNTEVGAAILRRAHGLIDIVHAWVDNLNPHLVETCNKIIADRVARAKLVEDGCKTTDGDIDGNGNHGKQVVETAKNTQNSQGNGNVEIASASASVGMTEAEAKPVVENRRRREDVMDVDVIAPANNEERGMEPVLAGLAMTRPTIPEPAVITPFAVAPPAIAPPTIRVAPALAQPMDDMETFVAAKEGQVRELEKLLVDVSSGMTVDALEGLLVRCENVLHEFRRNMNRIAAVTELTAMVMLARDDPALVGKLVA